MTENEILELFWQRHESAITEASRQYGRYCYSISYNILQDPEDAEECVNDTWLRTWNAIPPQRPKRLSFFMGRITRNLSLDKFRAKKAKKRGGEMLPLLEELTECLAADNDVEKVVLDHDLARIINQFVHTLSERECNIFLARYWYSMSLEEISNRLDVKVNTIKASLFRTRAKLKTYLIQEEVHL